jgi:hypothetical protein
MSLIIPANSAAASGGYAVDNSCRFDGSSSYLTKTGSSGNRKVFTFSTWLKRSTLTAGAEQIIGQSSETSGNDTFRILFDAGGTPDQIRVFSSNGNMNKIPSMKFRDTSAWYHVVMAFDTTQSTAADRNKIYVNGNLITDFSTSVDVDINTSFEFNIPNEHTIGRNGYTNTEFFGGYMAETVLIDGTQYAASDFGEFDEDSGIWKPIDVSGLTFGTNGFYLDFKDSANLGNDANGGTDLTESGLAAIDQSTDTCTNNFATLNPLGHLNQGTLSEGNLKIVSSNAYKVSPSTISVSSGKWYVENKITGGSPDAMVGVIDVQDYQNDTAISYVGQNTNSVGYYKDGRKFVGNSASSYGASYTTDDIIGIALDLDSGTKTITFYKNGASQGAINLPTAGSEEFYFLPSPYNATIEVNFGSPSFTISSGNTDGDGYGNFEYAVPSGYFSLNTKNLAEYG